MSAGSLNRGGIDPSDLAPNPGLMRWRYAKDKLALAGVSIGGISVIFAVVLIFFYLLWVVLPLFEPASMRQQAQYAVPGAASDRSLLYAVEEQAEVALRVGASGRLQFFDLRSGELRDSMDLGAELVAATEISKHDNRLALLDAAGRVHLVDHEYRIDYQGEDQRTITPGLAFPHGRDGLALGGGDTLAARSDERRLTLALADGRRLRLQRYDKSSSFLSDEVVLERSAEAELAAPRPLDQLIMDPLQEWLYAINHAHGQLYYYDLRRLSEPQLIQTVDLVPSGHSVTAAAMLAGGISFVTAGTDGRIVQWFPLRSDSGDYSLARVRELRQPGEAPVTEIIVEHNRRGFATLAADGQATLFYATSERTLDSRRFAEAALLGGTIAPRSDNMLLEDADGRLRLVRISNDHPEVSWKALWGKIWYESYDEPEHVWQSSAANSDFEPKLSLAPLSFGTLKAAFYAMLFAVPLAIAGAIFTAYFMAPRLRQLVKPSIEIMEALPTVILGFLAGLWLAPFVEINLPGIFLLILFLPLTMPLAGWLWVKAPAAWRYAVPPGWQPVLLVIPLLLATAAALLLSKPVELLFFGGDMPDWLSNEMGIDYDQRNSLVVGIAMGFAVIPTIFSIAEDAIFSVPKHLTQGSLALGASSWQTLVRVVLPTASPGIFSGLMIGLGRAVGETMIVLMATGNTPIMDMNIFEGFRTLSANIAVEMPESEVGSTHYRVLFLAGLVLFMFTFFFNTLAELVRQRLRLKYSSL